jgi:hypothetical protein
VTECYRCGQEGHHRSQCPHDAPLPPAAHPDGRGGNVIPLRRPADPDIARRGAAAIREALGWSPPEDTA